MFIYLHMIRPCKRFCVNSFVDHIIAITNLNQTAIFANLRLSAITFNQPPAFSVGDFYFGETEGYYDEAQLA